MFCHGDLYSNNIMFDAESTNRVASIIDWQLTFKGNINPFLPLSIAILHCPLFSGSALFDLARCVVLSLDPEICTQIEDKIFDFYYDQLSQLYSQNNEELAFTREQVSIYTM